MQLGWGKPEKPDPNIPAGMTQKQWKDSQYQASLAMLTHLGLANYHQNVKRGLLTDNTIMLWNDSVLSECKIPPGPRCASRVGLHHPTAAQPRHKGRFTHETDDSVRSSAVRRTCMRASAVRRTCMRANR
jgi:hypothetical protein